MIINNLKICNCGLPMSLVCVLTKLFSSHLMYWWLHTLQAHHLLSIFLSSQHEQSVTILKGQLT